MIPFVKMHGCGNDFVVIDSRYANVGSLLMNSSMISNICDRRMGVGCDQLIIMADGGSADIEMMVRNADGSSAGMCGNAARCVADIIMKEKGREEMTMQVRNRTLKCWRDKASGNVSVDMGPPSSTGKADVGMNLEPAMTVDVGNPHAVFMVKDADQIDLDYLGPKIEHHKHFPDRTNVEFVSVEGEGKLRMRVWERGAGVTLACGSGACATAYAAYAQGHAPRKQSIRMDGGTLSMEIREGDDHVIMTGPITYVFKGNLS